MRTNDSTTMATPGEGRRQRAARVVLATMTALALVAGAVIADVGGSTPASAAVPATSRMASDSLPVPQIDGVVWDQVVIGNTVYVGGDFTTARPAGKKPGEGTVARSHLLAYDIRTGELDLAFAPMANAQVRTLAASADGRRLFVGGSFTAIDGETRYRLAALDLATGSLVSSFRPAINSTVASVAVSGDTVFAVGSFGSAEKLARPGAAAFSASNGRITGWAPVLAGGSVRAVVVSPDGSTAVIGGSFTTVNGSSEPGSAMGAVDTITGALKPWAVNSLIRWAGNAHGIMSLSSDATSVYGAGYGAATFEGTFRASWNGGTLEWMEDCHGDSYSIVPVGDVVYTAGHKHYCGNLPGGGFPDAQGKWYRAAALVNKATGVLTQNKAPGYVNWGGQPAPDLVNWFPDLNSGSFTGANQGPWDVAASGGYVLFGGEFTKVNGVGQQGLARFATKDIAPNADGPRLSGADFVPTLTPVGSNAVRLSWPANYDRDDTALRYELVREGTAAPVARASASSTFWMRPTVIAMDRDLLPGQTYTYRVKTIDPAGNSSLSNPVSFTAGSGVTTTSTAYDRAVLADAPQSYWPFNETSGGDGYDNAGVQDLAVRAVSRGVAGIEPGGAGSAATFGGTIASYANVKTLSPVPDVFSIEAWFSTTTTRGGEIVGHAGGSAETGNDRSIYLSNAGRVFFELVDGSPRAIGSQAGLNDGRWHHVVATQGPAGMALYVDGKLVASLAGVKPTSAYYGYLAVGGHPVGAGRPDIPTSDFLAGTIDNVAIYDRVVSADLVTAHQRIGSTANRAPSPQFSATASGMDAVVDAGQSSDPDGRVARYAWSFGDGSTAEGVTARHTYAAAGTYSVTLTVTDDGGATASTSRSVTIQAPALAVDDPFDRAAADGWGSAPGGGAWTVGGGRTSFAVANGQGTMTVPAGGTRTARLDGLSVAATDVTAELRLSALPDGGGSYLSVVGRQVGSSTYAARVRVLASGAVSIEIRQGATTLKSATVPGLVYSAGESLSVRVETTGVGTTTIRAAVWRTAAGAAPAWQVSATDSTAALQAPGAVGVSGYVSANSTIGPVVLSVDRFRAVAPRP